VPVVTILPTGEIFRPGAVIGSLPEVVILSAAVVDPNLTALPAVPEVCLLRIAAILPPAAGRGF